MAESGFTEEFIEELKDLLANIDLAISNLTMEANMRGIPPYSLKHTDGSSALTPLLLAKAHAMHTMVLLRADKEYLVRSRADWLNKWGS